MIDLALIMACAPNVAPSTIQEIIRVESGGNPLAINVNKKQGVAYPLPVRIKSIQEAVSVSYSAISAGYTVDMGYMQVNSANLKKLGRTVEDMFDPCKNIAAGARILSSAYASMLPRHTSEQAALHSALSIYNTGNSTGGFRNGYVARYGIKQSIPTINPYTAPTEVFKKENGMEITQPVNSNNPEDTGTTGVQFVSTALEAERSGAFPETAITETEAWASNGDLQETRRED